MKQIMPDQASSIAGLVDLLFYFLCGVSILVSLLIVLLILVFAVRYRQRGTVREAMRAVGVSASEMKRIEFIWIGVPLVVFMAIFYWGASLYAAMNTPPADSMQVFVVGKQWMWKVQHLGGRREINELHVPVGRVVKLTMTSEDVIHSFYVPAFRVKNDVLPGRYTTLWFEATKVGEYHLFCAEYCGTKHSQMVGKVVVMEARDFQAWLGEGSSGSLAGAGEKLFNDLGCNTCHTGDSRARGPELRGLFGKRVKLVDGSEALADESYLRESILTPQKRVVAGYQAIMPSYVAQLDEEKVIQLIAYLKTMELEAGTPVPEADAGAPDAGEDAGDDANAGGAGGAAPRPGGGGAPPAGAGGRAPGGPR
jgi:cytochrome c oxidase subunit 2